VNVISEVLGEKGGWALTVTLLHLLKVMGESQEKPHPPILFCVLVITGEVKGKAIPLQTLTGPESSRRLKLVR
jgi:hypothetical protein